MTAEEVHGIREFLERWLDRSGYITYSGMVLHRYATAVVADAEAVSEGDILKDIMAAVNGNPTGATKHYPHLAGVLS